MTASVLRRPTLFLAGVMMAAVLAHAAQQAPKDSKVVSGAAAPSAAASAQDSAAPDTKTKGSQSAKVAEAAPKPADPSPQLLKDAANAGFKPEHVRGNLMFCRTTTEVGSRFLVRTCYGEDQVKAKIKEYQAERDQLSQQHNLQQFCHQPGGAAGPGGAATC